MPASGEPPLRIRDPAGWHALRSVGVARRLARGETLVNEGDQSTFVVLVDSGALKVVGVAANGQTAVLAVRREGDVVGEFAALSGRPRSASLVAVEPSVVVIVNAARLLSALERRPRTALALVQSAVARINEADRRRVEYVSYTMPERIRLVLHDLTELFRRGDSGGGDRPVVIPLVQHDVASLAGASREATARVLRQLREDRTVETGRSRIVVLRPDRLVVPD
jgi:CRP-like cAMP-binding protein